MHARAGRSVARLGVDLETGEYSLGNGREYEFRVKKTYAPSPTVSDPLKFIRDVCAKFGRPVASSPPIEGIEARLSKTEDAVQDLKDKVSNLEKAGRRRLLQTITSGPMERWYLNGSETIVLSDDAPVQFVTGVSQRFLGCLLDAEAPGCDSMPRDPPSYSRADWQKLKLRFRAPANRMITLTFYALDTARDDELVQIQFKESSTTSLGTFYLTGSLQDLRENPRSVVTGAGGGGGTVHFNPFGDVDRFSYSAKTKGDTFFQLSLVEQLRSADWRHGGFCATVSIDCPNGMPTIPKGASANLTHPLGICAGAPVLPTKAPSSSDVPNKSNASAQDGTPCCIPAGILPPSSFDQ
jgi:hypothetical protein